MEAKNFLEPKWVAIGLTVLVLVGGAWKIIASMSATPKVQQSSKQTAKAIESPQDGSYVVYETSWAKDTHMVQGANHQESASEIDSNDPNHMPYALSEEERAFALKAAKTWKGLPIAIEGRD